MFLYSFLEWLFLTRIFEAFGVILCLIALIVHIVFLPTRKYAVRAASIYTLGAAGKSFVYTRT